MTANDEKETVIPPTSREAILSEVAEALKDKRNQKKISIEDISKALNLRKSYIEALENGDWSAMPGEVYALGFLRQYAGYLNLDIDSSIENIKSVRYQLTKPLTFPDPAISPNKTWMIIALIAFILLFIGLNVFDRKPAPLPSQLMQQSAIQMQQGSQENAPQTLQNSVQNDASNAAKTVASNKPEVSKPMPTIKQSMHTVSNKEKLNNKPEKIMQTSKSVQVSATNNHQKVVYHYRLTAVAANVWLQLHDNHEPPVLVREVLLKKGETMSVNYNRPLSLTSGNPQALEIYLNNQRIFSAGSLGEVGKVLRKHLLQK